MVNLVLVSHQLDPLFMAYYHDSSKSEQYKPIVYQASDKLNYIPEKMGTTLKNKGRVYSYQETYDSSASFCFKKHTILGQLQHSAYPSAVSP